MRSRQPPADFGDAPGTDPAIDHAHIGTAPVTSPPPLSQYPTIPPASGPHEPTPLPAGVYNRPPDIYDQAIHSLEHAGATSGTPRLRRTRTQSKQIKAFYTQTANVGQSKVIVAPYDYSSQGIERARCPAACRWRSSPGTDVQTCATPSLAVAFNFTSQYSNGLPGGTYKGVGREPEPAALGAHGEEAAQTPAPATSVHGRGRRGDRPAQEDTGPGPP